MVNLNLYVAEFVARERAKEIERKARRRAALHPMKEWDDTPMAPSHTAETTAVVASGSQTPAPRRKCASDVRIRSVEEWRLRRACRDRRHVPSPSRPERIAEGRE